MCLSVRMSLFTLLKLGLCQGAITVWFWCPVVMVLYVYVLLQLRRYFCQPPRNRLAYFSHGPTSVSLLISVGGACKKSIVYYLVGGDA